MFAIAFDLVVADAALYHPKGVTAAYNDIGAALARFSFERIQGSVYVTKLDDMANLFAAVLALKSLPWFPRVVRDLRGFRIESWSDFTPLVRAEMSV